jgi:hypothetical protein
MRVRPSSCYVPRHALLAEQASRSGWRIIFVALHFHACVM